MSIPFVPFIISAYWYIALNIFHFPISLLLCLVLLMLLPACYVTLLVLTLADAVYPGRGRGAPALRSRYCGDAVRRDDWVNLAT